MALSFKLTEQVEQWIWIKFCIKCEHSSMETIQMIQKVTSMGSWWLAASSQQCACSCIMSFAECFGDKSNYTGDSSPYSPDLVSHDFWLFPKLKLPLKGKKFQTIKNIQENLMGSWWWLEELCEFLKWLLWRGLRCHCPMYNVVTSSINVSIFHSVWLGTFWTCIIYGSSFLIDSTTLCFFFWLEH